MKLGYDIPVVIHPFALLYAGLVSSFPARTPHELWLHPLKSRGRVPSQTM